MKKTTYEGNWVCQSTSVDGRGKNNNVTNVTIEHTLYEKIAV